MSVTFYTVATGRYVNYVVPYITSALYFNQESRAEILTDRNCLSVDQIAFLDTYFKDRWEVRILEKPFINYVSNSKLTKSIRWLSVPKSTTDYIYIGDADILVLESNIEDEHSKHAKFIEKPYSNMVRPHPTKLKLTGLHFVNRQEYYSVINYAFLDHIITNIRDGKIASKYLDEILLYNIVKRAFGVPNKNKLSRLENKDNQWQQVDFRPTHGIHTTLSRPWTGWGPEPVFMNTYSLLKETDVWKDGCKVFGDWYVNTILECLEPAAALWDKWMEWKRRRARIPREIILSMAEQEEYLMQSHKERRNKRMDKVLNVILERYRKLA